jgi:hypothetical protein
MPETEYNAWNRFRNNDYENFKTNCLHNTRDYGVIRFEDRDVNKKLCRTSEFIEIYHKDATRTPCVVIEADTKNPTIVHYLYRDPNFLKKFGSLEVLAFFDSSASSFRDDIINGYRGLDTTYEFCQDFDIRNEQYRELKKLLLSDAFSIKISEPDNAFAHQQTYQSKVVSEYYRPVFRIISSPTTHNYYINLLACNSKFFDSSTNRVTDKKEKEKVDFIPLLYHQKVLINRLVNHLVELQKSWSDADRQRLWALRGIEKGSK